MTLKAYSVLNDYSKEACTLLETVGIDVALASTTERPSENELIELVQKYDILIIGAKEKMTPQVFQACTQTKIVGTLSVGIDHICNEFLSSTLIKVINCPTSNIVSVAEHTFALLLALKKKIIVGNKSTIDGSGRKGINGLPHDIFGTVLGVIGAGRIATEVIRIAQAFKLQVICNTRNPQAHNDLLQYGIRFVDLDDLLSTSDIVTIHLPLTEQTRGILGALKIDLMKESAVFLNTSRAELVDIPYLVSRIEKKQKFFVGMDIDIDKYQDLLSTERNNLIITPHIAGISLDAIIRMDTELAHSIAAVVKGR